MRIAREVHDVVGHLLVAITLQAWAGLRRLLRSPERTSARPSARSRPSPRARARGDPHGRRDDPQWYRRDRRASTAHAGRPPRPRRVDARLSSSTHLVVDPAASELAAHLQSAAYRIVQSHQSNAAKHAVLPAPSDVRITHAGEVLTVEVTDDSANAALAAGDGSGLRGMRERAEQLGGSLEVGPALTAAGACAPRLLWSTSPA